MREQSTTSRAVDAAGTYSEQGVLLAGEHIGYTGARNFMNVAVGSGANAASEINE